MTVVVTIQHPGHVHFFRHAISELRYRGEDVHVFVRREPPAVELLEYYGIPHTVLVGETTSMADLPLTQLEYEYRLFRRTRSLDPELFLAIGGVAATHVARLHGAESVVFTDTEHATLVNALATPFASTVYVPDCYRERPREPFERYPGYHELAYLHPDRFTPRPAADVRGGMGVAPEDDLVVLRLSNWKSSHDVGAGGFDDVTDVVEALEAAGGTVRITAERAMDDALEPYRVAVPPHRMHDVLAAADLFVGEGATMAAESAVLGTPAVYVNSLELGYLAELDAEYGLVFPFHGPDRHVRGVETAQRLLERDAEPWDDRRRRLLSEKCDTTTVVMNAVDEHLERPPTTAPEP